MGTILSNLRSSSGFATAKVLYLFGFTKQIAYFFEVKAKNNLFYASTLLILLQEPLLESLQEQPLLLVLQPPQQELLLRRSQGLLLGLSAQSAE